MITNQTFPSNLMITSEVQVNSWNAGDMARAGVGLYTNTSNGNGYNLVFHGTNQVQFLDDKVTWGNAYTFNWQVGTWYWFQLAENNGTLEGKVWAAGTAEPQNWMFQQTGWTNLTEAPGAQRRFGQREAGSSTVSFASVSVTTTSVQPDTASAAPRSQPRRLTSHFQPGSGHRNRATHLRLELRGRHHGHGHAQSQSHLPEPRHLHRPVDRHRCPRNSGDEHADRDSKPHNPVHLRPCRSLRPS